MKNDPYMYEIEHATDRRFAFRPRCPVYVVRYCGKVIGRIQQRPNNKRWIAVLPLGIPVPGSFARRRDAARALDWGSHV